MLTRSAKIWLVFAILLCSAKSEYRLKSSSRFKRSASSAIHFKCQKR